MNNNQNQILSISDTEYDAPIVFFVDSAKIKPADYEQNYQRSIEDAESFWSEIASQELDWFRGGIKFANGIIHIINGLWGVN